MTLIMKLIFKGILSNRSCWLVTILKNCWNKNIRRRDSAYASGVWIHSREKRTKFETLGWDQQRSHDYGYGYGHKMSQISTKHAQ